MDVRLPIGGLLTVLGCIIAGYGLATNTGHDNLNLWWGIVMLACGLVLLGLARRR